MEPRYVETDLIIEINRKIIDEWNQRHHERPEFVDVSRSRINEVLQTVRQVKDDADFENKIITKAAHLLGGLAWAQAFSGANKRTALLSTSIFLRRNGFRLIIPKEQQRMLRKMLFEVQELRDKPDPEVIHEIILYIKENIVTA